MLSFVRSDLGLFLLVIPASGSRRCCSSHRAGIHWAVNGFVLSITSFWIGTVKLNADTIEIK
jgi:hypothetical protein